MTARRNQPTLGQAAWRACKAHAGEIAGLAAVHVLSRLAAAVPLILFAREIIRFPEAAQIAYALTVLVFMIIPLRFWEGERLRCLSGPNQEKPRGGRPYGNWLKTGLVRWGLGCLWGLPFLICAGYLAYGWAHLPFTAMWMPVQEAARLVGREPGLAAGLPVAGGLMLLFTLLFAYGWWRYLPAEYLPARHLGAKKTWFFVRRARKRGKNQLIRNAFVNMLLTLPGWMGFLAVLARYVRSQVSFSVSPELIAASLMRLMKKPLPADTLWALLAVFLGLYLPMLILRKMRSAVLIRRLTRECGNLGGGHAAG